MKWFVVLRSGEGLAVPMTDDNDWLALFDTEAEARKAADANPYGRAYGYEVYGWSS